MQTEMSKAPEAAGLKPLETRLGALLDAAAAKPDKPAGLLLRKVTAARRTAGLTWKSMQEMAASPALPWSRCCHPPCRSCMSA